jgi:hypothetical protein
MTATRMVTPAPVVERGRPGCGPHAQPEGHHAFRAAGRGQRSKVDRVAPAELGQHPAHLGFRIVVVAAEEHVVLARDPAWVDHDRVVHGVERLDHLRARKSRLKRLPGRGGVRQARDQDRWHAVAHVERVRHVDHGLSGDGIVADGRGRGFDLCAVHREDHAVGPGGDLGKGAVAALRAIRGRPARGLYAERR